MSSHRIVGLSVASFLCAALLLPAAEFPLAYRPDGFDLEVSIPMDDTDFAFKKEPDFGKRRVVRGAIPAAGSKGEYLGFAWDEERRELHLDLNRNLDLTDDEGNPLKSDEQGWGQRFPDITIPVNAGGKALSYKGRITFWRWPGHVGAELRLSSGWTGEVELRGRKWDLGIADDLSGSLDGEDLFVLGSEDSAFQHTRMKSMGASKRLFLDGQLYEVSAVFAGPDEDARVTFKELDEPLAQVDFEGERVSRLLLRGPALAIVEEPDGRFTLPAGMYSDGRVFIAGQDADTLFEARLRRIEIKAGQTNSLRAGAPLNHSVRITRAGSQLNMDYRLRGVGEEEYSRADGARGSNPRIKITCKDREVATGQFEYG